MSTLEFAQQRYVRPAPAPITEPAWEIDSVKERSLARKLAVERALAAVLLVFALPLIGICWVLVRLTSKGPGFYLQERLGRRGRKFLIVKLRTMTHECEKDTGAVWAQAVHDPRQTFLGKFLRRTHLDELPQLFNVLRGEMSLVGPRPERPEIVSKIIHGVPNYQDRLSVLPGVTGLAQVLHHADQTIDDVREKVRYDLLYIARMSPWLDLRILFLTALKVVGLNRPVVRRLLLGHLAAPPKTVESKNETQHREPRARCMSV